MSTVIDTSDHAVTLRNSTGHPVQVSWDTLRAAAEQDDAGLRRIYSRILVEATRMESRRTALLRPWFAVVTFGSPTMGGGVHQSYSDACRAASEARGTGSCTTARVYACLSRWQAESADISVIRRDDVIVYEA